jgi:hypothetical protein
MQGISSLAEEILASQDKLSSIALDTPYKFLDKVADHVLETMIANSGLQK